jgi:tetratricopeptide (TPR) repeat protein
MLLGLLLVLYFSFRLTLNIFDNKALIRDILYFFVVITGLFEAIYGLKQLYGFEFSHHNLFRTTGSFFNPGPYAGYLAVIFPMALYFMIRNNQVTLTGQVGQLFRPAIINTVAIIVKWTGGITCTAILLILPTTMSRASWLAAIAGSTIVIYRHYSVYFQIKKYCLQYKKKMWIVGFITIVFLFATFVGLYFLKKNSANGRLLTWKISLYAIAKHPFGVGLGNFSGVYGDVQSAYVASGNANETEKYVAGNPEYGFNEYLQILTESGMVSFLLFLGIIVLTFRSMQRNKDWGSMGSLITLLVFAFFSYPFSILPYLTILVFLLSANEYNNALFPKFPATRLLPRFIVFVCFLTTSFCLYAQYPVYNAYRQWHKGNLYYRSAMYKEAIVVYAKQYPYLQDEIRFLFEYAQSLSKSEQYERSNKILHRATQISCDPMLYNVMGKNYQALKKYEPAEQCLKKAANLVPSRIYPYYLLAKLYKEMELLDKAREMADIVLTKEPKVQSQAVEEMREEMKGIVESMPKYEV